MKKLLLSLALLIWLTSCNSTENQEISNSKKEEIIKIWAIVPLSGWAATYWEDAVNSYNMILEEINAKWWINWKKFELITEDWKCEWKWSVTAIQKLINVDWVKVIVWWLCSGETVPAWKIAQSKWIVMISPISSSPEISKIWDYIFRYYNDDWAWKKMSEFLKSKNANNVAILVENADYWLWYLSAFKSAFSWNIIIEEKFQSDEKDFNLIAKKFKEKESEFDFIIFISNKEPAIIWWLKSFEKEWISGKIIWPETLFTDIIKKEVPQILEWLFAVELTSWKDLWEKSKTFVKKFKEKYEVKSADLFITLEADAISLAIEAIWEVWNNSEKIKNYIQNFTKENKKNWYLWEYYFDKNWDAIWLDFLVNEFKNWEKVKVY